MTVSSIHATLQQAVNSEASVHIIQDQPRIVARLESIHKRYGDTIALGNSHGGPDGFDLQIRAGEVVALLGPNGAGKTTVVRLLLGLTSATEGTVTLFGGDPRTAASRLRSGAMLQVARVPETLRVREHIDLFRSYYPKPLRVAEIVEAAGLTGIMDRLFSELSGGQKQRVLFALAICGDPDIVFLDEPTVGLDVEARRALWKQIRSLVQQGKTVLLTTHYLEEADALADRIVVINHGKLIAEGTPAEIKARTAARRIRCNTTLDENFLRTLPGITEVTMDRHSVTLTTLHAEAALREMLSRDLFLSELEVTGAGLEDAFLALTSNPSASIHESTAKGLGQ